MRLLIGLAILVTAFAVLIWASLLGPFEGFDTDQFGLLAYMSALLVLVAGGFWHRFRYGIGANLRALLIWFLIGAAVLAAYAYKEQAREVGGTLLGVLRPGTAVTGPNGEVVITRRADGDFAVFAEVNGRAEQRFAFDTGASAVVLTAENAAALGIRPGEGDYTTRVSTANGVTQIAPIRLAAITIGPITERDVDAMVSRPGALRVNLLGQSFLTRLPSYEVRGDRLILRSR